MRPSSLVVAMILFVLTFASILPIPLVEALQNGPRMNHLYFKMYTDGTAEWEGLKINEFDVMAGSPCRFRSVYEDGLPGLSKAQYAEWLASPGLQQVIDVEEEVQMGMYEIDINCNYTEDGLPGGIYRKPGVPSPTGDPLFRAAIAKLVDKTTIAGEDFAGLLEIKDVPLAPPIHNDLINPGNWGSNYAFPYDGYAAQIDLTNAGYTLSTTPNPYYATLVTKYPWAARYMRINKFTGNLIQNDFDWGAGLRGLVLYSRADMPLLASVGRRFCDVLRASGIPVLYLEKSLHTCFLQVKAYFSYHFHTGGWRLDRDPDHLHDFYTSEFANPYDFNYMLFNGQGPGMPYEFTVSTALETALDAVKYAPTRNPDMITAAKAIQDRLWGPVEAVGGHLGWFPGVGGMPSIILGDYQPLRTPYRKGWMGIVNMQGVGVGNWWSYLIGYKPQDPTTTTMRVGVPNRLDSLNPVTAEWTHDGVVIETVYDPLIGYDPYNLLLDAPMGLAEDWLVGTWDDGGTLKTNVRFTLRSDPPLKWHPNGAITFPDPPIGDGGSEDPNAGHDLTVDDVAFSWLYHQAQWGWFYSSCYQIKEVVTKNGPPMWPIPALENVPGGSGLTATWTQDTTGTLGDSDILAKMDVLSFLPLHWLGEVPIIPMFIWKHVWDAYAFDPIAYDAVIGSGPYKLAEDGYVPDVSVTLTANRNYYLTTDAASGEANKFVEECFHRRGDAGSIPGGSGGSGPGYYDGKVDAPDLYCFCLVYLTDPYTDYPMPIYWRDDRYTKLINSPPQPPTIRPVDGTGQESTDGTTWGPVIAYPWRVKNPMLNPPAPIAYLYSDFNYDHYVDAFDLSILGQYWGTDSGSGW